MKTENIIEELTFQFSLEIINLYKLLIQHNEYFRNSCLEVQQVSEQTWKKQMQHKPKEILSQKCQ